MIATKRAVTCLSHMLLSPVGLQQNRQRKAAYGFGSLPPVRSAFCRLHRVSISHPVIPSFSLTPPRIARLPPYVPSLFFPKHFL